MEEEQNCKKGKKRVDSAVLSVHAAIFFEGPKVLESSVVQCAAPRSPYRTGCSWSRATTDIFSHIVNLRVFGSVFAKTARFR